MRKLLYSINIGVNNSHDNKVKLAPKAYYLLSYECIKRASEHRVRFFYECLLSHYIWVWKLSRYSTHVGSKL